MAGRFQCSSLLAGAALLALLGTIPSTAKADEIRLKDGKKLYGVIVAYEDNMFKVKTDFGYVLVEKDKIASIVPSTPAKATTKEEKNEKVPAAKKELLGSTDAKPETAAAQGTEASASSVNASAKSSEPAAAKTEKPGPKITNAAVKPAAPATARVNAEAPTISASATAPAATLTGATAQPAAPKAPDPPAMREEIRGNLYTNFTHGFKMYKAPSWELIEDARQALPNAIVALGTFNQSTLMVIGQEKTKDALEPAAASVEKRLQEIYENYRRISQRKTVVGGLPAIEYRYRGMADDHDWSGTLAVVARGNDIFTVLGMTYADSDLIQIQENVISRSIASLEFSAQ